MPWPPTTPRPGAVALFLVNRDQTEAHEVTVDISALDGLSVQEAVSLWDDDRSAANTLENPERVGLTGERVRASSTATASP